MTTQDFITELFCCIDDKMKNLKKHSQASLYPSELVTLGEIFAFTVAAFNLCTGWYGLVPDKQGFVVLSLAEFGL